MSRFAFVFVAALLIAAGASFLLFRVVGANSKHPAAALATSAILIASRDLQIGTVIGEHDFTTGKWFGEPPQQAARKKRLPVTALSPPSMRASRFGCLEWQWRVRARV